MLIFGMIMSGCSYRVLDFTLISSKNVNMSKSASFVRGENRVEGMDRIHIIFTIPIGIVSMKEAVDRAIETTPGCVALLDGVIYRKSFWLIFYGRESIMVEGMPLIDPALADNTGKRMQYGKIELDRTGAVKSLEEISPQAYYAFKDKLAKDAKETNFEIRKK
jgi:hypothetical protein